MGRPCSKNKNDEMVKRIMEGKPEGRRGVERPCSRWRDAVQEDVKKLIIQNWGTVARDREVWRRLLREAVTRPGLYIYTVNYFKFILSKLTYTSVSMVVLIQLFLYYWKLIVNWYIIHSLLIYWHLSILGDVSCLFNHLHQDFAVFTDDTLSIHCLSL